MFYCSVYACEGEETPWKTEKTYGISGFFLELVGVWGGEQHLNGHKKCKVIRHHDWRELINRAEKNKNHKKKEPVYQS